MDWMFTFACAAYNLVRMRNLALQFQRCKSRPKCVLQGSELDSGTAKTPKIKPFNIAKDEKQREKQLQINFSAAC